MESDVIAAGDWILANKDTYGIKVVNISMAGSSPASFRYDPLDQAVERLWFAGITVVAAAGNFGDGSAVDMSAAPGNDPFIITVGAVGQNQTSDPSDDTVAPWSAYGFTADGFSKPDIAAPGRYMVMPVPMGIDPSPMLSRIVWSHPATCGCPAPRSRLLWSRAPRRRSWPGTPTGRPIRSRAPSC